MATARLIRYCASLLAGLLLLLAPSIVLAQGGRWEPADKGKARLKFDAPGLIAPPDKLEEYMPAAGERIQARQSRYLFGKAGGSAAIAFVLVNEAHSQFHFFDKHPPYDQLVDNLFPLSRSPMRSYVDTTMIPADAPLGPTPFRRFQADKRSCLVFGSNYGRAAGKRFEHGGAPVGTIQISGIYCGPLGRELSQADARLVLSRLGYDVLGQASGPAPPDFSRQ